MTAGPVLAPPETVLQSLALARLTPWTAPTRELLFSATTAADQLRTAQAALAGLLPDEVARSLLPLAVVDEASLACTVTAPLSNGARILMPGTVVRVFLTDVADRHQLSVLDVDPLLYAHSLDEELTARGPGLNRVLDEIGPAYERTYIDHDKRPRDFVVRPVRIACQNVIVALAAIAQDSTFDGLSVPAWQTCEVPHVATHEGNRALAALTLCDAFARGGTMEIRFDRRATITIDGEPITYRGHPEGRVPASLRRYGRTVGLALGAEDPAAITPREARNLFLAVTPMPADLRARVHHAAARAGLSPERACYALLSQVWREVELDMLLATSEYATSILAGGADWTDRAARQAESDAARAALMAGMYYRRLNGRDTAAASDGVRIVEDVSAGVTWTVDDATATLTYHLPTPAHVPWNDPSTPLPATTTLTIAPRVHVSENDLTHLRARADAGQPAALLLPQDITAPTTARDLPVLRCPDRLADLDRAIEDKLLTSRIARA